MRYLILLLCLFAATALHAQTDMRIYTVAGNTTVPVTYIGDGGPATSAGLVATEGVWMDCSRNLYITDMGHSSIRKVNLATGIITTVAGGFATTDLSDGGPATTAKLKGAYGLYVDSLGNIFIAEGSHKKIRKVDAVTNVITTYAGGGVSLGDGGPATNALLVEPGYVYGDKNGNIYIGERARIRKVNRSGIISTIAGTGTTGLSGDNGPATNAQLYGPAGMLMDAHGNLLFADRANHRIRKINTATGIITTIAGTTIGYSGDGGPATAAQLGGPISFAIDKYGNLIIGDNGNNYIRKVDAITNKISTIAGVGMSVLGDLSEGVLATTADIHPEFLFLDLSGNLYYSDYGSQIRKITNLNPSSLYGVSNCPTTDIPDKIPTTIATSIYPNPTNHLLHIDNLQTNASCRILSIVGTAIRQGVLHKGNNELNIKDLPPGIYLLEMNEDGKRTIQKIIKQ